MRRLGNVFLSGIFFVCVVVLAGSCARPRPPVAAGPPKTSVPAPKPTTVTPPAPKPVAAAELRGVWVSDTPKLDWDSATANLQRAGFNTMYVNFASGGAAFYPASKVLPSVSVGATDAIAKGVELARKRGIAVHAKQIVMFMFKTTPEFQRQLLQAERVMRGPDARPILQAGFTWLCPSQEANRALTSAAVTEMLSRYRVDGLQFDYIRFSEQPSCYCANCRREFERSAGTHFKHWPAAVLDGPNVDRFNEWRKSVITDWVREISDRARRTRPGLDVSAAVFSDLENARKEKAQDWKLWLERRYLDYVCTMTYTTDLRDFETKVRKQQVWAPNRSQVAVGIGSWKFDRVAQVSTQIDLVRRLGTAGFVLFSYDDAAARSFLPDLNAPAGPLGPPALKF